MEEGYSFTQAKDLMVRSIQLCKQARLTFCNSRQVATKCYIAASCGPFGAYLADGSEYRGCYGVSKGWLPLLFIYLIMYIYIYI